MQGGFDVDIDRKIWSLDTGTKALLHPKPRPKKEEDTEAVQEGRLITAAYNMREVFRNAQTVPQHTATFSRDKGVTPAAPSPDPEVEAPAETRLALRGIFVLYLTATAMGLAAIPIFINQGPAAPYHVLCTVLPVALGGFVAHVLLVYVLGQHSAAAVGVFFLLVCAPVTAAVTRDTNFVDIRWASYPSLLVAQGFFLATLRRRGTVALLGVTLVFYAVLVVVESIPSLRRDESLILACLTGDVVLAVGLALVSAHQYARTYAVVSLVD